MCSSRAPWRSPVGDQAPTAGSYSSDENSAFPLAPPPPPRRAPSRGAAAWRCGCNATLSLLSAAGSPYAPRNYASKWLKIDSVRAKCSAISLLVTSPTNTENLHASARSSDQRWSLPSISVSCARRLRGETFGGRYRRRIQSPALWRTVSMAQRIRARRVSYLEEPAALHPWRQPFERHLAV